MKAKRKKSEPRDKDIHCCPSLDCAYHISYDRCTHLEAPSPGHSRCVGSRLCEEWTLLADPPYYREVS